MITNKFIKITVGLILASLSLIFLIKKDNINTVQEANEKPRIVFTNFHPHHSGGHLPFIRSIITSSLSNQYDFAVIVPETSDIYTACQKIGSKTYACDFPGKFKELPEMLNSFIKLRKIWKEYKPDIIHTNGGHDNTLVAWSTLFLNKPPKIVRTYHGTKIIGKDPYHWLLYNKLIDANLFVSTSAYKLNKEKGGLNLYHAYVIENGVDLEKFQPQPKNLQLRQELNIPDNYFIFGSSAGTAEYKRLDLMLSALTHFPKNTPMRIIILGHNPKPWIEQAKSMGVGHFINYVGYHENVSNFCSLFDAGFILSTRVETSSFASREMLAMGIPLISSSYSGLKDNIDNYVNGILVEPDNVDAIVNAMICFLTMSKDKLETYKKHARLKAENFDVKLQIEKIGKLYDDLLTKEVAPEKSKYNDLIQALN